MDDKTIEPQLLHDLLLFFRCIQEFDIRILLQHHPRVWEKSEYGRPQSQFFGIVYEALKYFTVTYMYSIESSDCNGGEMLFIVFGNALDCYHSEKK
jgi:hypothetical protein